MHSYAAASRADNTWKAYQSDLKHFAAWCAKHGIADPVPAEPHIVAAYLADYAGQLAVSTLARRLYALDRHPPHGRAPVPTEAPEVQAVWSGIKRTHGTAPRQKAPTRTKLIARMLKPLGDSPTDVRDRALLLIGFAGAFRRSELVALNVDDITDTEDGLHIAVHRSKSDQEGAGDVVGIPYGSNPATCPVRAWRAWLEVRREVNEVAEGPAFVSIPKGRKKRRSAITGSPRAPSRRSSSGARKPPDSATTPSLRTRCVRGSRRRRSVTASPSCPLCGMGGGSPPPRCGGMSAKAACGVITPRRSWGYDTGKRLPTSPRMASSVSA